MSVKAEYYDIVRKPLVTEKSTMASENGAVVFEVSIGSNKPQIKEAIEAPVSYTHLTQPTKRIV